MGCSREKVKRIEVDVLARLNVVVEPIMNEGGKKRYSPPAQEMPIEKTEDFFRCL